MEFWLILKFVFISLAILFFLLKALKKLKNIKYEFQETKTLSENLQTMAKIGGWQLDIKTQKSTWTNQTYLIHDVPKDTPIGVAMGIEFYSGEDKERITKAVQDCFEGKAYREILRFTSAKGVEKWVECAGEPVYSEDKKIYKLRGTIQDVTESINLKIESEKKHSETKTLKMQMSMIMNHSPAAVYECLRNENWTMKYISSFIEKLSGYPATDFINDHVRSYASIIHPDDLEFVERTIQKSVESSKSFDLSYRILTKQREERVVWARGSFEASSGNLIGIIFDQTEQKSYEKLLDESQSVAKLGNWSFDLTTKEIKWSQQMYHLFHEKKELGPPTFEKHQSTIHPADRNLWDQTVTACAQKGTSYKMRFRVVHPDQIHWMEAIGRAVRDRKGQILSLSGTCQDVTEAVLIEETLNKQRLKNIQTTKLASLGEMSAGVAHEINNPLAIISGNIQLLLKDPPDFEKLNKKLEMMMKATDRISKIVNGLKKFSRMRDQTEKQPQLLSNIVQETLYILEMKAQNNNVKLQIDNQSVAFILCNSLEIEQVVINLVNNSFDAIKKLQEKWIVIKIFDHQNHVVLQVEDSVPLFC